MKKSEYKLTIGVLNPRPKKQKDIILEYKENELMADIGDESMEEKVKIWKNS